MRYTPFFLKHRSSCLLISFCTWLSVAPHVDHVWDSSWPVFTLSTQCQGLAALTFLAPNREAVLLPSLLWHHTTCQQLFSSSSKSSQNRSAFQHLHSKRPSFSFSILPDLPHSLFLSRDLNWFHLKKWYKVAKKKSARVSDILRTYCM